MPVKPPDGVLHQRIKETLRKHPRGITTKQMWEQLGRRRYDSISSTLSKLHMYGVIDAEPIPHSHGYRWKPK